MVHVVRDAPAYGDDVPHETRVAGWGSLAEDGDCGDEEDEEKEENGAGENEAEDELARGDAATGEACRIGWRWREGGWGGRDHWARYDENGRASIIGGGKPVSNGAAWMRRGGERWGGTWR